MVTIRVEDDGLHFAFLALRRKPFAVEIEIEGRDVSRTYDDLLVRGD